MARPHPSFLVTAISAAALIATLLGGGRAIAQEATPVVEGKGGHPAGVHEGTCDALAPDPVAHLSEVTLPVGDGSATPPAGMMGGMATRHPVETSTTTIEIALDDLLATPHAVAVHAGGDQGETTIACGEIAGTVRPHMGTPAAPALVMALAEANGSGYAGMAWLQPNDDGTTTVTIYLAEGMVGHGPMGRPGAATPAASGTIAVEMGEYYLKPTATTFRAGVTYTFEVTNVGEEIHELVIEPAGSTEEDALENDDDEEAEVADIDPGATGSLTWTFTEPGRYQMACHEPGHFEGGMVIEIEVVP